MSHLRGWVRITKLAKTSTVSRTTVWRVVTELNKARLKRHSPPLLRRRGPHGGVLEVNVDMVRADLNEGSESLAERADALDFRLRRIESGHAALRCDLDRVDQRLAEHIARQDKVESATGKALTGLQSSIEGLLELDSLRGLTR